jgi:hypothetical protein
MLEIVGSRLAAGWRRASNLSIALSEELKFTPAAKRCGISQPPEKCDPTAGAPARRSTAAKWTRAGVKGPRHVGAAPRFASVSLSGRALQ